jgi:hypothetical protein
MTQVKHVKSAVLVDDEDNVVTEQLKSIAQQTEVDDL